MKKEQCPECAKHGGDTTGDNLAVYDNGSAHCFACGYHVSGNAEAESEYIEYPVVMDLPKGIPPFGIKAETCASLGVKHIVKRNGGVTVLDKEGKPVGTGVLFFPLHDVETGRMIGYVRRDWKLPKKDGMRTVADKARMSVFGLNALPKGRRNLYLVEGITDTMTVYQEIADPKVDGVLGILGTEHGLRSGIPKILGLIYEFERVVLCFDPDEAGQNALAEALPKMPVGRAYTVSLPLGTDPNKLLLQGQLGTLNEAFKKARRYVPNFIASQEEVVAGALDKFFDENKRMGVSTGYPPLDRLVGGYAPGRVIMWAAPPKNGKTTFLMNLAYNCYRAGIKQLFIPLEMTIDEVILGIASIELGVSLMGDKDAPKKVDRSVLTALLEDISNSITFTKAFGGLTADELEMQCLVGIDGFGASIIWLDHVTAAGVGMEVAEFDEMLYMLKGLAMTKQICLNIVTHVNDVQEYKRVQVKHLRGSRALAQVPNITLGIMRCKEKGKALIYTITAERFIGEEGEFTLYFKNGRFSVDEQKREGYIQSTSRKVPQSTREALPCSTQASDTSPEHGIVHTEPEGVRDTDADEAVAQPDESATTDTSRPDSSQYSSVSSRLLRPDDWSILRDKGTVTTGGGYKVQSGLQATASTIDNSPCLPPYSLWG